MQLPEDVSLRRRYRIRSRDEERYLEAVDEARENVRVARRDYHNALDELEVLEDGPEDPADDDFYKPRRRGRPREEREPRRR